MKDNIEEENTMTDPNVPVEFTCPNCQKDTDVTYIIENERKITHNSAIDEALSDLEEIKKITNGIDGLQVQGHNTALALMRERLLALKKMSKELKYCSNCVQMTNHEEGICLKCKEI